MNTASGARAGVRPAIRATALGAIVALVLATGAVPALAEGDPDSGEGGGLQMPAPAGKIDLLKPAGELLSGRPWLITAGLDPSVAVAPGTDVLTGADWASLDSFGGPSPRAPGGTFGAPTAQAAGGGAPVPYRNPGPAFSRNLLVTRDFGQVPYQTEPSLTVDPTDPEHLILGVIDYSFPDMSAYVSYDAGEHWEGPHQVPYLTDDLVAGGDPVLGFDRDGNAYYGFISIGEEEFNLGTVQVSSEVSSIAVSTSSDGGTSWPQPISAARSGVDTEGLTPDRFGRLRGNLSIGFLDKPWLAVGPSKDDQSKDVIYVTYTDFNVKYEIVYIGEVPVTNPTEVQTTIRMVSSSDGGETWTTPVAVGPTVSQGYGERGVPNAPGVFGTDRTVQGSQPVVAPDGTIHVAWVDSTDDKSMEGAGEIQVATSTDGGATFSSPVTASYFSEIGFRPRNAFFRYWASEFPQMAVGPNGELYITYVARPPEKPGDDGDVYFVESTDVGETWTRPTRLNDDDGSALQFFPAIAVDPKGSVHVMWGDMRDDPNQTRFGIYYTRSDDAGTTWGFVNEDLDIRSGDTRVSDFASNPNYGFTYGLFLGDYFSIEATDDDVYMVWADTRLGEYGTANQKVAFARGQAVTAPSIFISPPSGPGGQAITIQGSDYQPDMFAFVQLGDQTIATMRTDKDGRFSSQIYMPITSQGPQTVSAFDESGNGASTSYFTEFGFGDIEDLIKGLGSQNQGGSSSGGSSGG